VPMIAAGLSFADAVCSGTGARPRQRQSILPI
jgi:hypothetical protein